MSVGDETRCRSRILSRGEFEVREPREECRQGNKCLQSGQGGARAMVGAMAECHVVFHGCARRVERIGGRSMDFGIAAGTGRAGEDRVALRDRTRACARATRFR